MYLLDFGARVDGATVRIRVSAATVRAWALRRPGIDSQAAARRQAVREARLHLWRAGVQPGETWRVSIDADVVCERLAEGPSAAAT